MRWLSKFDHPATVKKNHPFSRSGLARKSDLQTQEWQEIFRNLEDLDEIFHQYRARILDASYPWPLDPLHTWSRVWEYPYAFYHLYKASQLSLSRENFRVLDYGSGVTFFPFAVASLGIRTTCADVDSSFGPSIERGSSLLPFARGPVDFAIVADGRIPTSDSSFDIVYCISVLEHIPRLEEAVCEIYRVMKPGGLFILTFDICTSGDLDIGVDAYQQLMLLLYEKFKIDVAEQSVHPSDILTTSNSLFRHEFFPGSIRGAILSKLHSARNSIGSALVAKLGGPAPELTVAGFILRKPAETHFESVEESS